MSSPGNPTLREGDRPQDGRLPPLLRPGGMTAKIAIAILGGAVALFAAAVPGRLIPLVIAAGVFPFVFALMVWEPAVFSWFVVLSSALAGLLVQRDELGLVVSSGVSLAAVKSGMVLLLATFGLLWKNLRVIVPLFLLPFVAFSTWTVVRWAMGGCAVDGARDLVFHAVPWILILYVYNAGFSARSRRVSGTAFLIAPVILLLVYSVLIPLGLIEMTSQGPRGILNPRPLSLFLLVTECVGIAVWKHGTRRYARPAGAVATALSTAIILFSLSRMASIIALGLWVFLVVDLRRPVRAVIIALLAAALAVGGLLCIPQFRARFFFDPALGFQGGLRNLDLKGRMTMWSLAVNVDNWAIGDGPGAARRATAMMTDRSDVTEYYPHNEYLQTLHDFGVIGLVLFIAAWASLGWTCWRCFRRVTTRAGPSSPEWSLAALLSVGMIAVTALTDNTLHYVHVTAPAALVVGFALLERWKNPPPGESAAHGE